jgi:hypothetical protein
MGFAQQHSHAKAMSHFYGERNCWMTIAAWPISSLFTGKRAATKNMPQHRAEIQCQPRLEHGARTSNNNPCVE